MTKNIGDQDLEIEKRVQANPMKLSQFIKENTA